MKEQLDPLFDEFGNCPTLGDPYREGSDTSRLLFGEDGFLKDGVRDALAEISRERRDTIRPFCDLVRILVAEEFAGNTKGNYSTIYLWR